MTRRTVSDLVKVTIDELIDTDRIAFIQLLRDLTQEPDLEPQSWVPEGVDDADDSIQLRVRGYVEDEEAEEDPDARDEEGLNAYDRALAAAIDAALDAAFEQHDIGPSTLVVTSATCEFGPDSGVVVESGVAYLPIDSRARTTGLEDPLDDPHAPHHAVLEDE